MVIESQLYTFNKVASTARTYRHTATEVVLEFGDATAYEGAHCSLEANDWQVIAAAECTLYVTVPQYSNGLVYFDETHFSERFSHDKIRLATEPFALLNYKGLYLYADSATSTFSHGGAKLSFCYIITNSEATLTLRNALIALADYNNKLLREAIFYSTDAGVFAFRYGNSLPFLAIDIDYTPLFQRVVAQLKEPAFARLFVAQFPVFLKTTPDSEQHLPVLIACLSALENEVLRNLTLYLKGFSWETFRTKFEQEREKYFAALRDVLNKVLGQSLTLPAVLTASAYLKLDSTNPAPYWLVVGGFLAFLIILIEAQLVNWLDILQLRANGRRASNQLQKDSGLSQQEIILEFSRLDARISLTEFIIGIFTILAVGLTAFVLLYLGELVGAKRREWVALVVIGWPVLRIGFQLWKWRGLRQIK